MKQTIENLQKKSEILEEEFQKNQIIYEKLLRENIELCLTNIKKKSDELKEAWITLEEPQPEENKVSIKKQIEELSKEIGRMEVSVKFYKKDLKYIE